MEPQKITSAATSQWWKNNIPFFWELHSGPTFAKKILQNEDKKIGVVEKSFFCNSRWHDPPQPSQQMTDPPSHPADLIGFLGSQRDELGPNYQPRHQWLSSIHLAKPVKRYLASKDKAIELMLWASTKRCSSDKTWGATCWWLEERATTGFLNHQQY